MDLSYILVEACDKDGNCCPLAENKIEISISGPGRIAGVGNGNPRSLDPFQGNAVSLFYGKAMIILGSGLDKGNVKITASSEGLTKDVKSIKIE
jgi:beta-galactosidase